MRRLKGSKLLCVAIQYIYLKVTERCMVKTKFTGDDILLGDTINLIAADTNVCDL